MKLSKILLTCVVSSMLFTACKEEDLDILPILQDPLETAITDETSLEEMLLGGYAQASSASLFGANILIHGDIFSDNVFVSNDNSGYFLSENSLNISQQTDYGQLAGLYRLIIYANIVLNHTLPETDNVRNIEGQAHMMRAIGLFYAANLFASNPTSGQYQEYGVPVYTEQYNPSANYARSTVAETYEQIITDLELAISKMNQSVNNNKGQFSPTAAKLLLSRVYLTRGAAGDYQKALNYATDVINNSPAEFGFVAKEDYVKYFNSTDISISENAPETVWEINFTATNNPGTNSAMGTFYSRTGPHGSLLFRQSFLDLFDAGDERLKLLSTTGAPSIDDPTGVWTTKWPRNTSEGNFTMNVKVLRMSEAKLNRIEALYHLGQTSTALTELNQFAATRGANTPYTGADLLSDILTERRKEFFAEGQRFYDLKRNNMGYSKDTNCAGGNCQIPANSKYFVFPMPELSEMLLNPLMTQHPLWQ